MNAQPQLNPKPIPKATDIKASLVLVAVSYAALGIVGIVYLTRGGQSWDGDANTLTTVLAVLGAVFSVLSRALTAQCTQASVQRLANRAISGSVSLGALHRIDVALRGSVTQAFTDANPWGLLYRVLLPILAIFMSAVFKKAFDTEIGSDPVTIRGIDASFVDPTDVGAGIRGLGSAGAIMYNTTISMGTGMNPTQKSWTYIAADLSDLSGLESVQYFMPSLPKLVATGSAGYIDYSASSVPALVSQVQCSSKTGPIGKPQGSIQNDNNDIYLDTMADGTARIQVRTAANIGWSCLAHVGMTNGTANFTSDTSGNWNISSVNMSTPASVYFSTTPARWNMISDIISDALGQTVASSGWNWTTDTSKSPGYTMMLLSTRLSFATATLAFSSSRPNSSLHNVTGEAHRPVQKVVLQANWALKVTTACLLLQALVALSHIWFVGKWKFDFGILQIMEMRAAAALTAPADAGTPLLGHCSKLRTGVADNQEVAIRSNRPRDGHLGFVRCIGGETPTPWRHMVDERHRYT